MPTDLSLLPTHGQFLHIYMQLRQNKKLFDRTPIVFCEGDSWFSTPLYMNILDWLVFATPQEEELGVPVLGRGGLFYRAESSGHLAVDMFTDKKVKSLMKAYKAFEFDIALLSGGGNDFVSAYLKKTFAAHQAPMTVDDAFQLVVDSGRYDEVKDALTLMLDAMVKTRPHTPIVMHTYCYPLKLNEHAPLTLGNIGAVAAFKKRIGPWIAPHVKAALPDIADQRAFARKMIDGFAERVLFPLAKEPRFKKNVIVLDLRNDCPHESDWFDEMHPTGAAFHRLSKKFEAEIRNLFELP
ncbi:MAG TPA: hypothetical protein VNT81_10850 [Vicinamibacterales bacterium]|nr:hypothetical protein [Vicinamibacterales bacterium]